MTKRGITKETLFKPSITKLKADRTNSAAWQILDEEAAKRRMKTDELRAKRLAAQLGRPEK